MSGDVPARLRTMKNDLRSRGCMIVAAMEFAHENQRRLPDTFCEGNCPWWRLLFYTCRHIFGSIQRGYPLSGVYVQ